MCSDLTQALMTSSGMYEIIAIAPNGRPAPIYRLGGIDTEGILYVGQSTNVRGCLLGLRTMVCSPR